MFEGSWTEQGTDYDLEPYPIKSVVHSTYTSTCAFIESHCIRPFGHAMQRPASNLSIVQSTECPTCDFIVYHCIQYYVMYAWAHKNLDIRDLYRGSVSNRYIRYVSYQMYRIERTLYSLCIVLNWFYGQFDTLCSRIRTFTVGRSSV